MKKTLSTIFMVFMFLFVSSPVLAAEVGVGFKCGPSNPNNRCLPNLSCQRSTTTITIGPEVNPGDYGCFQVEPGPLGVFGKIIPPQAIINFGFGSEGISKFLSNLVALIFSLAAIVLIFMILWGAFDWMTSEGDKEKVARARDKIINAIIGILLFAAAFAILKVLGQFTGFKFFV